MFNAGVVSVSVSLGLQSVGCVLLFLHKGTRIMHQALCSIVIVGLIVSVSTFLSGPTHLQSLCFNIPSQVSIKAVTSPGGQRCCSQNDSNPKKIMAAFALMICIGWLLVSSMLGQIACLVANHWLLAASVQLEGMTLRLIYYIWHISSVAFLCLATFDCMVIL
jgi:hypothetical protein